MPTIDSRLQHILGIVKPGVAVPVIFTVQDQGGETRRRELESLDACIDYVSRLTPNLAGNAKPHCFQAFEVSGIPAVARLDEPVYAMGFRSTEAEIRARLEARLKRTLATNPPLREHVRGYLGGIGPLEATRDTQVFTLQHVRQVTKSDKISEQGFTGKGAKVAVLDTGADQSHPMLDGQVKQAKSFVPEDSNSDLNGHGSWCASAVAGRPTEYQGKIESLRGAVLQGMAPDAELWAYKVLTGEGSGSTSGVMAAMEEAALQGADVLSMSLGSLFGGAGQTPDAQMVDALAARGVQCVIASGNSFGFATVGSPGSARGAITVGSHAIVAPSPGVVSSFSSKGPITDGRISPSISAPGGNIRPDELLLAAGAGVMAQESAEPWALARGTSMATPVVAGIVTQLLAAGWPRDRDRVEEVLAISHQGAFGVATKNNRLGWGAIDALRLLDALKREAGIALKAYTRVVSRTRPLFGQGVAGLQGLRGVASGDGDAIRMPFV